MSLESNIYAIPIRVRWGGWDSHTHRLKQAGWKVWAGERMMREEYGTQIDLALTEPGEKMILHGTIKIDRHSVHGMDHRSWSQDSLIRMMCDVGAEMSIYRTSDRVMVYEKPIQSWHDLNAMKEIDGFAQVSATQEFRLHDLNLFRYSDSAKDIYIPHKSVDLLMNEILSIQYPEQLELKKKDGTYVERPVVQAKIYSLAA